MEYVIVGILVAAAAAYAAWRLHRALAGKGCGCAFSDEKGSACGECPETCAKEESGSQRSD